MLLPQIRRNPPLDALDLIRAIDAKAERAGLDVAGEVTALVGHRAAERGDAEEEGEGGLEG